MKHDEHGLPVDDDGNWLSPEQIRAAQARVQAHAFFDDFPKTIGTYVLLEQGDVWIDKEGERHEVASMDPTYCANVLRFLQRRAITLEFNHSVARLKLIDATAWNDDERWIMAQEGNDDVRRFSGPPLGHGLDREAWLRDLSEWAWGQIRRTPLIVALQDRARDRQVEVEEFFAGL